MIDKIINSKPAKYPETSVPESDSLAVFEYIISRKKVKTFLKKMDKIPNYDGYLEITEDDQTPIGKIEVQLKKLSDDHFDNPKYQCNLKFLSYSETSLTPILLIGVDTTNDVAYWILVDRDLLISLKPKIKGDSINVDIPKENLIKKDSDDYLSEWVEIIQKYQTKLFYYDTLKQELELVKESYSILIEKSESTLGIEKNEFINIHKFLDLFNYELDTNFRVIKDFYFPSAWKIGFACDEYSDTTLSYVLYPIPYNKNDVQIKKISKTLKKELIPNKPFFISHFFENPIKIRYESYTSEIIHAKLKNILKNKSFPIENLTLAREFIFSFIDRFYIPLGLEVKDEFNLNEIEAAFMRYLPIWVEESLKYKEIIVGRQNFIDPNLILSQLLDNERDDISKKVQERILKEDYYKSTIDIGNDKYSFILFHNLLTYLKSISVNTIKRLYIPNDYNRVTKSSFIWSYLSPDDVKKNIKQFFEELPDVYDSFLDCNFPNLKSQLHFFKDFDRLIIVIDVKEKYEDWQDYPSIQYYYLINKEKRDKQINIYMGNDTDAPLDFPLQFDVDIKIDDNIYLLYRTQESILDFIYQELSMFNYIYELLNEKFDLYFET